MSRFEILVDRAEEGGFGRIDKARDTALDRDVAIKTLDPLFQASPSTEDRERFHREAKTLAALSHPNIPAIYDVTFEDENEEFRIIFEWIEGLSVRQYLIDHGVLSLEQVKRWLSNITSALDHAHSRKVIHRDIKPANLIISSSDDSCYLVDFGISLRESDMKRLTSGSRIGTLGYMSLEQEAGEELGPESDVYSLGVVLYECLSGTRPALGEYRPLNGQNEAIPPTIDYLVKASLESGENRIKTVAEFQSRLDRALQPHGEFAETLTSGSLYEIQVALSEMTPSSFGSLPAGQKRLILVRLRDLVNVDAPHMRNAVASLLAALIRIGQGASERDFSYLLAQTLHYGWEHQYGEHWRGNRNLRVEAVASAAIVPNGVHDRFAVGVLEHFKTDEGFDDRDKWYYHDLRDLLQSLLANPHCSNDHAEQLGDLLGHVNDVSHKVTDQPRADYEDPS